MGGQETYAFAESLPLNQGNAKQDPRGGHCTPLRSAESKEVGRQSADEDVSRRKLSHTAGGTGNGEHHPGKPI